MMRFSRLLLAASLSWLTLSFISTAWAQKLTSDPALLTTSQSGDYAAAMLDFLFRGEALPAYFPLSGVRLASIADALHNIFGVYNGAMLTFAALFVFYQIVVMVADTAHEGIFMGRRGNQIWGPVRLIIALSLLVPMGGGMSVGQHVVLRIAQSGSNLASHGWNEIAQNFGTDIFTPVAPRGPDLSRFILMSTEMELCREIYNQASRIPANNAAIHLAGSMSDLEKLPFTNITPETWRYTNAVNANVPLCGEYRFSGFHSHSASMPIASDPMSRVVDSIFDFSRTETEAIMVQTRLIAGQDAPFIYAGEFLPTALKRANFSALRQAAQQQIGNHLRSMTDVQVSTGGNALAQFNQAGWISAGFFIPNLAHAQISSDILADHILPDIQEPILTHRALTQRVLSDAIMLEPVLRGLDHETLDGIYRFYASQSRVNSNAHDWLYGTDEFATVAPTSFEVEDHLNAASNLSMAFGVIFQALNAAAQSQGVWGADPLTSDSGNPFAVVETRDHYNPLTAFIEFSRRQFALGIYLIDLADGVTRQLQITIPALLIACLGGAFVFFGLGMIFLICLFSFGRFLVAILKWLAELVEALVAIPLVALAHLSLTGEGITGAPARQAYMLWIALAIRPVLSLTGLVAGILVFILGMSIITMALAAFSQTGVDRGSSVFGAFQVGLTFFYDILACFMAYAAFKGITWIPDHALRWLSPFVVAETGAANANAIPIGSTVTATVSSLMHQMTAGGAAGGTTTASGTSTFNMGRMASLFPFYQPHKNDSPTHPGMSGKTAAPGSKTVTPAGTASSSSVSVGKNMPALASQEQKRPGRKDPKDAPFIEIPFPVEKKNIDTKIETDQKPVEKIPPEDEQK